MEPQQNIPTSQPIPSTSSGQANPTPAGISNTSPTNIPNLPVSSHEHGKIGPIIATLIVIIVIVIAAIYIFASRSTVIPEITDTVSSNQTNNVVQTPAAAPTTSAAPTIAPLTNKSDDLQSLQNDLNTSTEGVDSQNF
ncbi:MAG: hypothetical protein WCT02_00340 [Candidatus Paceibacterota bacterium]|jgi:hypothetical protein